MGSHSLPRLRQEPNDDSLRLLHDAETDFERYEKQFNRLAETDEERLLGRKVAGIYRNFKALGSEITTLTTRRLSDLRLYRRSVRFIEDLISNELQLAIDRTAVEATTKLQVALDMEHNFHEAITGIEGYVLDFDPELLSEIADALNNFRRYAELYRRTNLSARESQLLDLIDKKFSEAVVLGNQIIALTKQFRAEMAAFNAGLESMDQILAGDIQILIAAETRRAAVEAQDSGEIVIAILAIVGLIVFGGVAGVNWLVFKDIVDGVTRLSDGAVAFSRGKFDYRIELGRDDELGELAGTFNAMAEGRRPANR